jgi:hypothetical protein
MLVDGVVKICVREEGFHARLFEPFRLVFLSVLVISEVLAVSYGPNPAVIYWLFIPCLGVGYSLPAVFVTCRWCRYHVGPEGIEGYDFWGRTRTSWKAIARVRCINFLGMEYLLITGKSQRNVWVPLCVDRYDVLRRLLLTYAAPVHELEELLPESA